ncbi:hypothetical protein ACOSQ2_021816 [Xanthoceras sorbifolium]
MVGAAVNSQNDSVNSNYKQYLPSPINSPYLRIKRDIKENRGRRSKRESSVGFVPAALSCSLEPLFTILYPPNHKASSPNTNTRLVLRITSIVHQEKTKICGREVSAGPKPISTLHVSEWVVSHPFSYLLVISII